ncbi:MAG: 16S rRNA (cytosine(1402)-N(4))-methyltransferase [Chlamydiae bacterium RIFCSPHIGHO2_12_FULL_27_8]|nr:MAG: 16S rRNA (cytosine(1402)-N(4))-methyltransferase [Chlamydiae bacterium RIFCSPHIGHO2_12_FULL_27_8]OGN65787.1 MAG: 16S rRNA (cytosine(1402)-N(4))-methyltransferase [Chlamydiae bacterium RIFCSPLOWO2_01_FULL_28_7]
MQKINFKFSPHLKVAKILIKNFLKDDFLAIDATLGNGFDSLFLSDILKNGQVFSFDIQKEAIENSKKYLKDKKNITFFLASHEDFSKHIFKKVQFIIYNLGYLPGSDKKIVTKSSSTIKSINSALDILDEIGAICITAYPGHEEGLKEEKKILKFLETLNYKKFSVSYQKWINKKNAPSLFWIEKKY